MRTLRLPVAPPSNPDAQRRGAVRLHRRPTPRHWATNTVPRRSFQVVRKRPLGRTTANLRTQVPPMRAVTATPAPAGA